MVIKKLHYSGAYKIFIWLAGALSERGHEVTVMTFMRSSALPLNPKVNWIQHDELEKKTIFHKIRVLRRELNRIKPDVSISFLLDANVYNTFACVGLKSKSVICERNDPFKPGYWKLRFWKPWFKYADGAVFQLPKVAEYYNNIKTSTAVIPNPVIYSNPTELPPFERRSNTINILGRLDILQKRHDVLIDAFSKFIRWYPTFKLVFYGDGPDREKMQKQVSQLGLEKNVMFAGVSNNPLEVMRTSKMYILTSDFEGIPNALIEAMSIGLPCISTDCRPGGARLLIDYGVNGFIVPQGDSNSIAEKMKWYMQHPNEADLFGRRAMKITERFSEEKVLQMWDNFINSIL